VHVAARIGAAASSEEILVSSATLAAARSSRYGLSEPRRVTLKGVADPIEVRSVDWR
jgi:class 3 adenylate cyclase